MKNKKGFTLIELLAVIVILAIVTVLGATTVLPYLSNAGKNAFAIEANNAVDAASQAMSLYQIGSITIPSANITQTKNGSNEVTATNYCFTLEELVGYGLWTKDASAVGNNGDYAGTVVVTQAVGSKAYTYTVSMHGKEYSVNKTGGNVASAEVNNYPANGVTIKTTCP